MLISPPAWVNSTIRLSAAATQSMFSVPDSIEIRAPGRQRVPLQRHAAAARPGPARRSPGAHSGSDSAPSDLVGSPSSTTRVTPSGCSRGRRGDHAGHDAPRCCAPRAGPPAPARRRRRGRARRSCRPAPQQAGQLVRVDRAAARWRAAPSAGSRPAARPARSAARRWSAHAAGPASKAMRTAIFDQLAGFRVPLPGRGTGSPPARRPRSSAARAGRSSSARRW